MKREIISFADRADLMNFGLGMLLKDARGLSRVVAIDFHRGCVHVVRLPWWRRAWERITGWFGDWR